MKTCILAVMLAVLLASSYAWTPFKFDTPRDLLEYMTDEDHHIYILFFFNTGPENKSYGEKVISKEREAILKAVLEVYNDVVYAELDLSGNKFDQVAHEVGIETDDVLEYPTVVAVSDGLGKWVNGPNLTQLLVPTVNALLEKKKH
mmetsp:Transcript_726/g.858  ORF Transcript_726/g.858 Transcript_726/m.858 type:complete len:146 (-) Transcript_726:104-541(-)